MRDAEKQIINILSYGYHYVINPAAKQQLINTATTSTHN